MGCCSCKRNDLFIMSKDINLNAIHKDKGDYIITSNEIYTDKDKNSWRTNNIIQGKHCLNSLQKNNTKNSNKSNNQKMNVNTNDKRIRDTSKKLKQITFIEVTNIKKFFS